MTLEKIKENMRIKNMTVASLSRSTGLAYSTVYDIVHGNTDLTKCTCETVEKLNTALALSYSEEWAGMIRGHIFEEYFTTGIPYKIQNQEKAKELSRFFTGFMMATFASANIPINTRLEPILDVKAEDIDFAKGEQTFFCVLEDAYFNNWITKDDFRNIIWESYQKIKSLNDAHIIYSSDEARKFPRADYMGGFHNICNAAYYMDDIIRMPQITQSMEMEDTERWKEVRRITKDAPLTMINGFDITTSYKTADFQNLFDFLLTEGYNPGHTKEQRNELYCLDVFHSNAQEFIRRLSMACMDALKPLGCMENAFVFWWKENNVLLHAACVETGKGFYFTEASDDSIPYKISIHDQTKQNILLGYMPREIVEQRSGFEDICSPYMKELLHSLKYDGLGYPAESVWAYVSDAPRTGLRTFLFSIAEKIAKKAGIGKAGEWMNCAFTIWQYARLFPENIQVLVEEYLHIQQDELTKDMEVLEGMLFTAAVVPYKNEETKKWYVQTIDNEKSEITFSTKKDMLFYIRDIQRDLYTQLQNVLEASRKGDKESVHFRERSMYSYWVSLTEAYGQNEAGDLANYLKEHGVPVQKKKTGSFEARKYEYSDIDALDMQDAVEKFFEKHQKKGWRQQTEFRLQGTYTMQNNSSICVFRCFGEYDQNAMSKELWDAGYHVDVLRPSLVMVRPKSAGQ